jgi:hypothetical protein
MSRNRTHDLLEVLRQLVDCLDQEYDFGDPNDIDNYRLATCLKIAREVIARETRKEKA